MSTERIETPDVDSNETSTEVTSSVTTRVLSANAKEFKPLYSKPKLQMRPSAPEFIPEVIKSTGTTQSTPHADVSKFVRASGYVGIPLNQIPVMFYETFDRYLDLSSCRASDLSVLIREIPSLSISDSSDVPGSLQEVLAMAGLVESSFSTNGSTGLVMGCQEVFMKRRDTREVPTGEMSDLCPLGTDAGRVVIDAQFARYIHELRTFKESIVEVVSKTPQGLLLSSFGPEWDKFFVSKGLAGMPEFKSLAERFNILHLEAFLHAIPNLELSQESSGVRVKCTRKPSKTGVVVLHDELFREKPLAPTVAPPCLESASILTSVKKHISPALVTQLLSQVDRQVLELGSLLASRGLQTSAQDLVLIRLQLQQLQSLKTSLQAVSTPVQPRSAEVASNTTTASSYAALLSQAAQFAMSAISTSKKGQKLIERQQAPKQTTTVVQPVSGISTAATSRKASPTMTPSSAQHELTKDDLKTLVYRVVEKSCKDKTDSLSDPSVCNCCELGMPASSIKDEWKRMFPSIAPLETYLTKYGYKKIKNLVTSDACFGGRLVVFYATLPSPQLRVATRGHFVRFFDARNPTTKLINPVLPSAAGGGAGSPLISPTSTCSFTSDVMLTGLDDLTLPLAEVAPTRVQLQHALIELLLKKVKEQVIESIHKKAQTDAELRALEDLLIVVSESERRNGGRLLDSKRPPPIDTGSSSSSSNVSALIKQFTTRASEIFMNKSLMSSCGVSLKDLASIWRTQEGSETASVEELVQQMPGIRLQGERVSLTAVTTPGALVSSVFSLNDPAVWTGSNSKLVKAIERVLSVRAVAHAPPAAPTAAAPSSKVTHAQLTALSSILFKTIMAGGPGTAKECASALKVLAAKDPKSIHEIVSKHISTLSSKSETAAVTGPGAAEGQAAMDFISSLMTRGKQLHDDQTQERLKKAPPNQEYIEKLRALLKSEPVVVPEAAFKAITQSYSREELLDIRQRLEARGLLHNPPEGLKAGLKVTKQTSKKNVLRVEE